MTEDHSELSPVEIGRLHRGVEEATKYIIGGKKHGFALVSILDTETRQYKQIKITVEATGTSIAEYSSWGD